MSTLKKFYINSSIPYVNGELHVGHTVEFFYADVTARYHRDLLGEEVRFVTGTDEHGQKNADVAESLKIEPQEYVDSMAVKFEELLLALNMSHDDFVRTTQSRHHVAAQKMWQVISDNGFIEKGEYEGLYCVGCEEFKTEKDLDEEGNCPNHKKKPDLVKEENYFFKLSAFQDQLSEFYSKNPEFILPKAKFNEMKALVENGLEDLSVSRDKTKLSWGVPVPGDDTQVMYVWFDALMNYVTTAGYAQDEAEFSKWWPTDFRTIGKDINRFHTVVWPAMLMAAGLPLEKQIGVHGFITINGDKISKSIGNVIQPLEVIEKYGLDPLRYFLLREVPFDSDGDFSYEKLEERYSADLANGLGNLLSRVTNMVEQYFDGEIKAEPRDAVYKKEQEKTTGLFHKGMEQLQFHLSLQALWGLIDGANEYIEETRPWEMAKEHKMDELQKVLAHLVYVLEVVAAHLGPFIPGTAQKVSDVIATRPMKKAEPLFPRLDT